MSSLGCYLLYTHTLQCTPASLGLIPPGSAAVLREGRGGKGRRALGDPGAQPGTTGFQNNSRHSSIPCATTLPPQSRAFFLSRNWFVPCGLVAFLFGFWGGGGKMYLTRPSPHPLSIQAEVKGWHRPGTKSPLSSFTCLNLSVLVASQALSRTRLLGLFHW